MIFGRVRLVVVGVLLGVVGVAVSVKQKKGAGPSKTIEPPRMSTEDNLMGTEDNYMREFIAILGGVLGFWGGVGSMGTVFLFILMTQRYCCRPNKDKDESG